MSKRKAGVNDIIYELDNDDIEISSEDETKNAKYKRLDAESTIDLIPDIHDDNSCTKQKYISLDSNEDEIKGTHLCTDTHNGGKTSLDSIPFNGNINLINDSTKGQETDEINNGKLVSSDGNKTTIFNEDIDIDSPTSISDLGVVGCENRTPLISVRFRDKKLAANYKRQLKTFMLNLIKLHENELSDLDNETDIELDIWPEDLNDDEFECEENNEQNGLFFVDTAPCSNTVEEVPAYTQVSALISNKPDKAPSPPPLLRRTPLCFNCDGAHQLRDCRLPRNNARIAEKRKSIVRVGRYHIEDEQKYGHLTPGRISGGLRHALGLKRHELPLYIYRMRVLGYPPGWLEEARISHSGITMFDSSGTAIQDPEEEEGEVCEPGSKDKFDIKKILDFPGFNVPASSRYKEEGHLLGMPPISEQDSKIAMLQMLAPNAMKAYKRKKLTLFPSSENNTSIQETAEMELDSGDEEAEFPTVPPLPDEEPPLPQAPPPPPQAPPPDSPPLPPGTELDNDDPVAQKTDSADEKSADDIEVLEVIKVKDIPVPQDEMITIDDDDEDKFQVSSGRGSPTLDDLELKKRALLSALEGELGSKDNETKEGTENNGNETIDDKTLFDECVDVPIDDSDPSLNDSNDNEKLDTSGVFSNDNDATEVKETVNDATEVKETVNEALDVKETTNDALEVKETVNNPTEAKETVNDEGANVDTDLSIMTPENKTGRVKNTSYGTPVMNIASSYVKLPSDDKFAKDICDVINFENLPNSTGKYKKICDLLKKVKNEVDRIQES